MCGNTVTTGHILLKTCLGLDNLKVKATSAGTPEDLMWRRAKMGLRKELKLRDVDLLRIYKCFW